MANHVLPTLILLYTEGRKAVEGATRFQKLVFLTQEETDFPRRYGYHADRYGPFSPTLHDDLDELVSRGLVERNTVTNEVGNEKHVFSITPDGIRLVQRVLDDERTERLFDAFESIKRRYNDQPLQVLLRYVYRSYPSYATETELDTDRLFDPDTRSQFLDPDRDESDYTGSRPGEFETVNPSPDELFDVSRSG